MIFASLCSGLLNSCRYVVRRLYICRVPYHEAHLQWTVRDWSVEQDFQGEHMEICDNVILTDRGQICLNSVVFLIMYCMPMQVSALSMNWGASNSSFGFSVQGFTVYIKHMNISRVEINNQTAVMTVGMSCERFRQSIQRSKKKKKNPVLPSL